MWKQDKVETQERYRERWLQYGYDSRSLGWTKDCQWVRFEAAFEGLRKEDFESVIDFGCGFGDLLDFLRVKEWKGTYTGVDLVDELVKEAAKHHALDNCAAFVCRDVEGFLPPTKAAMAVAIGVFNHRLHQDNLTFVRETISSMWEATTKVVVCDFLSTAADMDHRRLDLYYADPRQLYELATHFSRRVSLHHAYMPFEFQVKIWHEDSFSTSAPVFDPYADLAQGQTNWRRTYNDPPT
jgi:cyclopropane fatty-acyl-phospholipid synthase-like methyltransferase